MESVGWMLKFVLAVSAVFILVYTFPAAFQAWGVAMVVAVIAGAAFLRQRQEARGSSLRAAGDRWEATRPADVALEEYLRKLPKRKD